LNAISTAVHTLDVDKDFDEDSWRLESVKGVPVVKGCANVPIVSKYYSVLYFLVRFWRVFIPLHININAGWHFESIQDYENIISTDQGVHR